MRTIEWFMVVVVALPAIAAGQAAHRPVSLATIATVQAPAWLERDGRNQPLAVGMEVRNGDKIRTGSQARVYLDMAEGSSVKLGEYAVLKLHSRRLKPASNFKGALDVSAGAFRFTTPALQRASNQRDVVIRVGAATAGIRGTDLWGKSDAARDVILLIEGNVEVRHAGATFEMAEPLTYFFVPRNAPPQALTRVDPESFKQWARETEVSPGDGATQRGGKWKVLLARAGQQREALEAYDKARNAGYAAEIRVRPGGAGMLEKGGGWNYEVVLAQLPSEQEAVAAAYKIKAQLGFDAVAAQ
ncbi:MAG: FecR family protein [Proteobacteria bacterium]|nr:FecR family protein [Pseudomonadota bacterium]